MLSGQSQPFSASYDSTTRIISAVVFVLLAFIGIATQSVVVAGIAAVVVAVPYAYSPRSYTIQERFIIVHRLVGSVRISLEAIREARVATADDLRGCIRLWGNGGLFGYCGWFRTAKLGNCRWYVTNRRNTVVVITDRKTTLFSPDDVNGFLAMIGAAVPVPPVAPSDAFLDGLRARTAANRITNFVGIAIAVVVLAIVGFTSLYSPGPPSYTLTPTSLTIHDRFYPVTVNAAAVDVDRVRIIDIDSDPGWRPTERTNGFANAHYQSGWFQVANGRKVRMYRAKSGRVVLLPPKGQANAVLLEVTQPEQFVRAVRREWANRS